MQEIIINYILEDYNLFKIIDNQWFIEFVFCNIFTEYIKEIDGIFTEHKRINLYNDPKVDLIDGINNINNIGNDKNDLKCTIIYKNFVGSIIEENEPIILEIKKGFRIIDLLNQIKQNCKIFKRFECDKPIKMPKIAIGIICTNFNPNYKEQLDMLKANYKFEYNGKKLNYFEHITTIRVLFISCQQISLISNLL